MATHSRIEAQDTPFRMLWVDPLGDELCVSVHVVPVHRSAIVRPRPLMFV